MHPRIRGHAIIGTHRAGQFQHHLQRLILPGCERPLRTSVSMASHKQEARFSRPIKPITFEVTSPLTKENELRLGTLSMPGRHAIQTPHYIALSSRGAVPHISQDMMREHTAIKSIYAALEDCE